MTDKKKDPKNVKTPKFRVSYPQLAEAKSFNGQPAKYSMVLLFDKKTDLKPMRAAAHAAIVEEYGENKAKWPKKFRSDPFRDGSEKEDTPGYKGMIFLSVTSKQKPECIGPVVSEGLIDPTEIYAGSYAKATLRAFCYDNSGNKGVSFALQNVQKVADGEPFSGRKHAVDEFEDEADGSEDSDSYEDSDSDSDDDGGF